MCVVSFLCPIKGVIFVQICKCFYWYVTLHNHISILSKRPQCVELNNFPPVKVHLQVCSIEDHVADIRITSQPNLTSCHVAEMALENAVILSCFNNDLCKDRNSE